MYYILLLSLSFLFYKSPPLLNFFFIEHPQISIPAFSFILIAFNLIGYYLDKLATDSERNMLKLRGRLKDAKKLLISNMDPFIVQTLKEIIKKDLKDEL